ncbi:hypothetical protein XA68_10409 [Ophiocordyceps unilateralis]|uniref:tRNA (guanine(9)-N1)-methyltransferase n=1 Tax=Ophiocordyceps unilateralis TaxID=268505 RepID=A0A2A9PR51_OPHUN|nr:hypothetical protein XA68_10409 [Ophiocordyceps unilateralis]
MSEKEDVQPPTAEAATPSQQQEAPPPLSKNALKRLRKQQEWEDGREDRRKRRREKRIDRRDRRRAVGDDGHDKKRQQLGTLLVPLSIVIDCDFEAYMTDKERVSLASQVTRCYSDNRNARCRAHLWVAGWRGKIRDRFRLVLADQQRHWKGVGFVEGDYLACADDARRRMAEQPVDTLQGPLAPSQSGTDEDEAWIKDEIEPFPISEPEPPLNPAYGDVVYLTSESPYTLRRLEPNTVYVVGGLVDRNREKGLCYRRARERGIRTARLPITDFMRMQSRRVLATNHVVEILLRWLECGDWGEAFLAVIPKRKGGSLIRDGDDHDHDGSGDAEPPSVRDETPAMGTDEAGKEASQGRLQER